MTRNKTTRIRSDKSRGGYTQVSNKIILDPNISPNEKAILLYVFSRPDSWIVSMPDVANHTGLGTTSLKTAMKSLKEKGFVKTSTIREKGRVCGTHYVFTEEPENYSFCNGNRDHSVSEYDFCEQKLPTCTRETCDMYNTEQCPMCSEEVYFVDFETKTVSVVQNTEDGKLMSEELTSEKSPLIILSNNNTENSNTNNNKTNNNTISNQNTISITTTSSIPEDDTEVVPLSSTNTISSSTTKKTKSSKTRTEAKASVRQQTFSSKDYEQCFGIYFDSFNSLKEQGKIYGETPVFTASLYKRFKSVLKDCFSAFGVEKVADTLKRAVNDNWLIQQNFKPECVFGRNKLPSLCNNLSEQKKTKGMSFFSQVCSDDDYSNSVF